MPPYPENQHAPSCKYGVTDFDDYWLEYYRPLVISSFLKIYSYRINSTNRYLPERPLKEGSKFDFSPFVPRLDPNRPSPDSPEKKPPRKGVTIVDPHNEEAEPYSPARPYRDSASMSRATSHRESDTRSPQDGDEYTKTADKSLMHQWTLNKILETSLNPSVSSSETAEYDRYISHPLNLPLVVSSDLAPSDVSLDFVDYINSGMGDFDGEGGAPWDVTEEEVSDFQDFIDVQDREDALTVFDEDKDKKRYKAYRQWLVKGKSLFKQSKVDPEYKDPSQLGVVG